MREWEPDHPAVIAWRQQNRPRTLAERTYAVRERRGLGHPTGTGRRVRLTAGFVTLFVASTLVEEALPAAVALLAIGALCVLPEMIGGKR